MKELEPTTAEATEIITKVNHMTELIYAITAQETLDDQLDLARKSLPEVGDIFEFVKPGYNQLAKRCQLAPMATNAELVELLRFLFCRMDAANRRLRKQRVREKMLNRLLAIPRAIAKPFRNATNQSAGSE